MKKIILVLCVISFYIVLSKTLEEKNIIPKEAIRIRILANSNNIEDQNIKKEVKDNLESYLYNLLKDKNNVLDASITINSNLENIEENIKDTLNNRQEFTINFGKNYFPKKKYKGVNYEEGYYDSLLVKLGDGLGDNWWCVLFPPLCLLEGKEYTDVEYSTYVGELINKYLR